MAHIFSQMHFWDIRNTVACERSILGDMYRHHMSVMKDASALSLEGALVQPKPARHKLIAFLQGGFRCDPPLTSATCSTSSEARVAPAVRKNPTEQKSHEVAPREELVLHGSTLYDRLTHLTTLPHTYLEERD